MDKKVTDIAQIRAESRADIRDTVVPYASYAHLGELRAVAVVAIKEDGEAIFSVSDVIRETDGLLLVGLLEQIKAEIQKG